MIFNKFHERYFVSLLMQISPMFFIVPQRQANIKENLLVTEKGILLESFYSLFLMKETIRQMMTT